MARGEEEKLQKIVLIGTPNAGKSVIFRLLTGRYQIVSNYPGTTVEVSRGNMRVSGRQYEVIDTPGINSLIPQSEDEKVTCEILLEEKPSLILQVADAKNLRRTLLIAAQLAEFGTPMILILNMMDEAQERGISIDTKGIANLFGITVLETVAIYGRGLQHLTSAILEARTPKPPIRDFSDTVDPFQNLDVKPGLPAGLVPEWVRLKDQVFFKKIEASFGPLNLARIQSHLSRHSLAGEIAAARNQFLNWAVPMFKRKRTARILTAAAPAVTRFGLALLLAGILFIAWNELGRLRGTPSLYTWAHDVLLRQAMSGAAPTFYVSRLMRDLMLGIIDGGGVLYGVVPALVHFALFVAPVLFPLGFLLARSPGFHEEFGIASRRPWSGLPILLGILFLAYEFVGFIGAQMLVGLLEKGLFGQHLVPALRNLIPPGFIFDLLVGKFGLVSMGLSYAVAIVLPIVATFFVAFGILEDSGYLPRLSVLSDRVMRAMGLNGKAVLPMVLGLGCCTMATMTTRILNTRKERLIATILLALGVPCSAQLGVILGITSSFSFKTTLAVLGIVGLQLVLVGYLASKVIHGERSCFVFELPPIRVPQLKNILLKTGYRVQWYLKEAVPLFIYGTFVLFALDRLYVNGRNLLEWLESGFAPIVSGILHLPAQTAPVFVLGFLRRDYGAAGLYDMVRHGTLTAQQAVVALVVITLFVPCLASFLMMGREQGTKRAFAITAFIVPFAISVGAVVSWLLRTFEVFRG